MPGYHGEWECDQWPTQSRIDARKTLHADNASLWPTTRDPSLLSFSFIPGLTDRAVISAPGALMPTYHSPSTAGDAVSLGRWLRGLPAPITYAATPTRTTPLMRRALEALISRVWRTVANGRLRLAQRATRRRRSRP